LARRRSAKEFKENEADLVEVAIDYAAGPKIPKSHEGASGGALWELHVELDEEKNVVRVNKKLHGIVFRQSNDNRLVVSNAVPSIEKLAAAFSAKWPDGK
jgi:hypothetical protein